MPKTSCVTPLYNPAVIMRALRDTGLAWQLLALDLVSALPSRNAPHPHRVIDWANGSRPTPAWAEREAGRLLMRLWRNSNNDPRRERDDLWFARAYSPVYAAYLEMLVAGVDYQLLAPLNRVISTLFAERFGIDNHPGKDGTTWQ